MRPFLHATQTPLLLLYLCQQQFYVMQADFLLRRRCHIAQREYALRQFVFAQKDDELRSAAIGGFHLRLQASIQHIHFHGQAAAA